MCPVLTRVLPPALAACAAIGGALLVAVRRVEVTGTSMSPTLREGQRLAVLRVRPAVGRLVVVRDPRRPSRLLVKRCASRLPGGGVEVRGDNPTASTDSRHFGVVGPQLVLGRPVYRYQPADAAGWVWSA